MRLALLTTGNGWHTRDVERSAAALGVPIESLDPRLLHSEMEPDRFDAVLVRSLPAGSLEEVVFRMDVLADWHARGCKVHNAPRSLETCVDKYLTTALLRRSGLPVPRTIACQDVTAAWEAFQHLGGDVVVKPVFGSEGRGIMRVEDPDLAWRVLHALVRTQSVVYLQEFIRHPGWDARAMVLGGRVLGTMRRISSDWRTNVARGADTERIELHAEQCELALRAAQVTGAEFAGVDLLPGADGKWYVLEVNAVPGWKRLSETTGVDVATEWIRHVRDRTGND